MPRKINLLGQKFGKWTVIAEAPSLKTSYKTLAMWVCQCECGTIKTVRADDLRNGKSTQCKSCARKNKQSQKVQSKFTIQNQNISRSNVIDETGNQYAHFSVIKQVKSNSRGAAQWLCKCECGNEFIALGTHIRNQHIISCGCIKKSKGESKIKDVLDANNVLYQREYSFPDLKDKQCLRFDFAIFDNNHNLIKLIEFQGEQHYNNVRNFTNPSVHDQQKREYCKINDIPLLEIPYWDIDKIDIDYLLQ